MKRVFLLLINLLTINTLASESRIECHLKPDIERPPVAVDFMLSTVEYWGMDTVPSEGLTPPSFLNSQWSKQDRNLYVRWDQSEQEFKDCLGILKNTKVIAWIGDSLSKDFAVNYNPVVTLERARMNNQNDLFFDTVNPKVKSFFELVSLQQPVYAINLSHAGNNIQVPLDGIDRLVAYKKNLKNQVDDVLKLPKFPDFLGLWMGHNDLDFAQDKSPNESNEKFISRTTLRVVTEYKKQLLRLISMASLKKQKSSIVVYEMANIDQYANTVLPQVERIHARYPEYFPATGEPVFSMYESLRPENRKKLGEFYHLVNSALKTMVQSLGKFPAPNVMLQYSTALSELDLNDLRILNPDDGWHFSSFGKNEAAKRAYQGAEEALHFVGLK